MYCTFLWKIIIRGKYALGRRRSQAVSLPTEILYYCNAIFHHHFIFSPIICMTFKTLHSGGQLLLGFNYKLTWGHIISLHIIQGFQTNASLLWGDRWLLKAASNLANILNITMCSILGSNFCPILISIDFLKRFYYKDELKHTNPLMIKPIPLNPKQIY